ncbi:MAG: sigma factor, partial [Verrucomicrobiota bacterium]
MDQTDREQHDQFLRLFMEHEEALRLFARSMLFNQEETREVMQEVAIVLWRKFDPSLDGMSFRRWAFGVTRMEVLTFRRDRARDRHTFSDDVMQLLENTALEESACLERER